MFKLKLKRKIQQPVCLDEFIIITTTSTKSEAESEPNVGTTTAEDYFRAKIYFKVLDSIVIKLKKIFSFENMFLDIAVDEFMKLNYVESTNSLITIR
jgi:hypothetical protein